MRDVSVRTIGQGPQIVMLPGLAVSRYLHRTQDLLAAEATVSLVDLPGTGDAPDADHNLGVPEDCAAVSAWLESTVDGPIVLTGHSYGALLAARLAASHRDQVRAVVLASPTVDPAYRSLPHLILRWLIDSRREPRSLRNFQLPEQRRAGVRRMLSMVLSSVADDPLPWLEKTAAPVTIIRGCRDALSTREWCEALAHRPGGQCRTVPGVPHAFPFNHPEPYASAVRDAVTRTMTDGKRNR
jgi:pimeloyl-ACP methyl ester carboxylesterase